MTHIKTTDKDGKRINIKMSEDEWGQFLAKIKKSVKQKTYNCKINELFSMYGTSDNAYYKLIMRKLDNKDKNRTCTCKTFYRIFEVLELSPSLLHLPDEIENPQALITVVYEKNDKIDGIKAQSEEEESHHLQYKFSEDMLKTDFMELIPKSAKNLFLPKDAEAVHRLYYLIIREDSLKKMNLLCDFTVKENAEAVTTTLKTMLDTLLVCDYAFCLCRNRDDKNLVYMVIQLKNGYAVCRTTPYKNLSAMFGYCRVTNIGGTTKEMLLREGHWLSEEEHLIDFCTSFVKRDGEVIKKIQPHNLIGYRATELITERCEKTLISDEELKTLMKNEDSRMVFRQRFKALREKKGYSSSYTLAKDIIIDRNDLRRYENGQRFPGIKLLKKIAQFFEVTPEYLLGKEFAVYEDTDKEIDTENTNMEEGTDDMRKEVTEAKKLSGTGRTTRAILGATAPKKKTVKETDSVKDTEVEETSDNKETSLNIEVRVASLKGGRFTMTDEAGKKYETFLKQKGELGESNVFREALALALNKVLSATLDRFIQDDVSFVVKM